MSLSLMRFGKKWWASLGNGTDASLFSAISQGASFFVVENNGKIQSG